jgi:hypothetical protein
MVRARSSKSYKMAGRLEEDMSLYLYGCEVEDTNPIPKTVGETSVAMHTSLYAMDGTVRMVKVPISTCSMMKEVVRTMAIVRERR